MICTGVILAGGRNSRFDGKDKSQLMIGGQRILGGVNYQRRCIELRLANRQIDNLPALLLQLLNQSREGHGL